MKGTTLILIILALVLLILWGTVLLGSQKGVSPRSPSDGELVATFETPGVDGDVRITLLDVVEDSRCPIDVQCIQAGTVRVSVLLDIGGDESQETFTLGETLIREGRRLTLESGEPKPVATQPIERKDYIFWFSIE